ncbi:uncharacterized protein LOC102446985 [Pelodiscus sinensis]|uniref:uncharacterized protein LOC102446985 n=1 Tax=Pelodiscus sinensis TaxID=13735 RepID=UPI0003C4BC6E|nr:uncharacterized protein LOC102446985 [Pelodiscus sinensis]|eukprot:XP_006118769.1 uncharacterized protein LOC102446985 [Pelodiscus sinensis]
MPTMDARSHQELLCCLASNLGVSVEPVIEDTDPMIDILSDDAPAHLALPLNKTMAKITNTLWQTPASLTPTLKGVDRRYYVPQSGHKHLYSQPVPGSLVIRAAAQKERLPLPGPSPKTREPKCLDLVGRKVYATGGVQLRIANQQAMPSHYTYNTWQAMDKFKDKLPPKACQEFGAMITEGRTITCMALQASLDAVDSAARTMASGIVMRHGAWLQVSGIPADVQNRIPDLPFEGKSLFLEHTDSRLYTLKDTRSTLRFLGFHTPPPQRCQLPFRQQGRMQSQVPCGDYWRRRPHAPSDGTEAAAAPSLTRAHRRRPRGDNTRGVGQGLSQQSKHPF